VSGEERDVREVSGVIHHVIFARLNSENIIHPITIYRRLSAQLIHYCFWLSQMLKTIIGGS